jgi:hypothetical protein
MNIYLLKNVYFISVLYVEESEIGLLKVLVLYLLVGRDVIYEELLFNVDIRVWKMTQITVRLRHSVATTAQFQD